MATYLPLLPCCLLTGPDEDGSAEALDLSCSSPQATASKNVIQPHSNGSSSLEHQLQQLQLEDKAMSKDQVALKKAGHAAAAGTAAADRVEEVAGKEEEQQQQLSALQQLMQLCGQGTDESRLPSMEQLLKTHGFETSRVRVLTNE